MYFREEIDGVVWVDFWRRWGVLGGILFLSFLVKFISGGDLIWDKGCDER